MRNQNHNDTFGRLPLDTCKFAALVHARALNKRMTLTIILMMLVPVLLEARMATHTHMKATTRTTQHTFLGYEFKTHCAMQAQGVSEHIIRVALDAYIGCTTTRVSTNQRIPINVSEWRRRMFPHTRFLEVVEPLLIPRGRERMAPPFRQLEALHPQLLSDSGHTNGRAPKLARRGSQAVHVCTCSLR